MASDSIPSDIFQYQGNELTIFQHAVNWKNYWAGKITPYLGQDILEVGAGIGGTTAILNKPSYTSWTGIEPDQELYETLIQRQAMGDFASNCTFRAVTVQDLDPEEYFDSILYVDVLEHIEEDRKELEDAANHLRPGGYLIVLSPAFMSLYTPFDEAIGHFRRYTRKTLKAISPSSTHCRRVFYLDSIGMLASLGNRLFLRASLPTQEQILIWDRFMIPLSRCGDVVFGFRFGRSIIGIWQRDTED